MLVGKFHDKIRDSCNANGNFYKNDDQDDPNILRTDRMDEVCKIENELLFRCSVGVFFSVSTRRRRRQIAYVRMRDEAFRRRNGGTNWCNAFAY